MNNYCTLFDSYYLSRGLILHESLMMYSSAFHLFVFAFDDLTFKVLNDLCLKNVTVISSEEFESDELKSLKRERSKAEYCWTCTPSVIKYVMDRYNVDACTYIDSDLCFYSDPAILVHELDERNKNVLITGHRFSSLPRLYEEKRAGRFCVQFMTFKNEASSLKVLDRWREQCNEWCYARYEDGKFGDQKYLDAWPDIYDNVHIMENRGGGIAPWNVTDYSFSNNDDVIKGKYRKSEILNKIVFFHFQYVKMIGDGSFDIGWYVIPENVRRIFYSKYLIDFANFEKSLADSYQGYNTIITKMKIWGIKNILKAILKKIFRYNVMKISY